MFRRDKDITSHVFCELYLLPLLHSYAAAMLDVFADATFNKESVPWKCFEGRMHFLKELEVALGCNSFLFLPGFQKVSLSGKDIHGHVSQAVKVFIIQKLQAYFSSNISVFKKMLQYHQAAFQIFFYNAQPCLCQELSLHNNAVPFPYEEIGPPSATLQASSPATIYTVASSTTATASGYSFYQIDTSDGSSYNILFQISLYAIVYSREKTLRNSALFPNAS
jgi:hypothetical protein